MPQAAVKLAVFGFVLSSLSLGSVQSSNNHCYADNLICMDRVKEAAHKYPKYKETLLCTMKIAFIEPNKNHPQYTDCINKARETFAGRMRKGGTFNPQNSANWVHSLEKPEMRRELTKCINLLSECYDVDNLRLCLSRHEHL